MDKGWIKLSRQIQDHWIWNDPEKLKAWIDLILMANHDVKKVEMRDGLVTIKRGQFVTSIEKLAKRWGWSKNRVYRFLSLLEADHMVQRKANAYRTTITIVNYGKFQDRQNGNGTTDGTSDESANGSSGGSRTRKNKNEKEIKESAPPTSDEPAALEEDEEPPVPGAVKMANGGWNYTPDIDWDEVE